METINIIRDKNPELDILVSLFDKYTGKDSHPIQTEYFHLITYDKTFNRLYITKWQTAGKGYRIATVKYYYKDNYLELIEHITQHMYIEEYYEHFTKGIKADEAFIKSFKQEYLTLVEKHNLEALTETTTKQVKGTFKL